MESLIARFHLHPIVDHFTIALLGVGVLADVLGALLTTFGPRSAVIKAWGIRLRSTAMQLLVLGALASVLSHFTGESEAERLWDTMSPAAQHVMRSDSGPARFLSHAALGTYLMYGFLALALWRVLQELSRFVRRTKIAYLLIALIAVGALFYQGKTGGELVYEHHVGVAAASSAQRPVTMKATGALERR